MLPSIHQYCQDRIAEFDQISEERKGQLLKLSGYVFETLERKETPKITVICTHNSRRSHLGQVWLKIAAHYYEMDSVETYSGGTEATAFFAEAVAALERVGFKINREGEENPLYQLAWSEEQPSLKAFSKKYDHQENPQIRFGAIMVCTSADEACPVVLGANFRLALPFEDPKAFDHTPLKSQMYDERCAQIAREMLFVMSEVQLVS